MKVFQKYLILAAIFVSLAVAGYYLVRNRTTVEKQKPAVGESAPDAAFVDLNGKTVRLSDFRGKVVLLNFWASWCLPCRDEMPGFQKVFLAYRDKGFMVIAVALNDPDPFPMVKQLGIVFPVVWANKQVHQDYGNIVHIPVSFLIGKDGRIVKRVIGAYSESDLKSDVEQALK
jgi:thiol-disulfide isomerase/thioredoxin